VSNLVFATHFISSGPSSSVFRPPGPANIDSRLTDKTQDEVVAALKAVKISAEEMPLRKGYGTEGRAIKLRTNYFPVKVPKGPLFEYDVQITPGVAIKRVRRRIFQLAEESPDWTRLGLKGKVAHDHSAKIVASQELSPSGQSLSIRVNYYDEDETPSPNNKEYILTLNYVQPIDTNNLVRCGRYHPSHHVLTQSVATFVANPIIASMISCQ